MKSDVIENKKEPAPIGTAASQRIRSLVKNELTRRFQKNPSYSLRAFAKSIGMDQSLLSKILKGNRDLSFSMALKLGQAVGVPVNKIKEVLVPNQTVEKTSYSPLAEDQFMVISGWHHFAILELMQTSGFKPNANWIAKRLGISTNDVNYALERLENFGLIKRLNAKRWICKGPNNSWFDGDQTNLARKALQQQLLEKARSAIEAIKFEERENASLTVAVNSTLLPEIKKRIHKFKDEINELAMSQGKADEVYQLCVAFFPLTEKEKK